MQRALDAKQHCMLEMPTGTGKTITLLSLITVCSLPHASCHPPPHTVHQAQQILLELYQAQKV